MANTTALPRGRSQRVRIKEQADFATQATGNYFELNTYTVTPDKKKEFEDDDVTGSVGAVSETDARPAAPGVEESDTSFRVPLDLLQIGYWLKGLIGGYTVSAVANPAPAGTYAHVFASGSGAVPINTMERQLAAGQLEKVIGLVLKELTFPIGPDKGYEQVDVAAIARSISDPYTVSIAGAPSVLALSNRVPKTVGIIKIGGAQVGRVLKGSAKLTNTVDTDRYAGDVVRSDAMMSKLEGALNITARYTTDALRAYGAAGSDGFLPDPVQVEIDYVLSTYLKLALVFPAVRFRPVNVPAENGGTMTQQLSGRAESSTSPLITATLTNAYASY